MDENGIMPLLSSTAAAQLLLSLDELSHTIARVNINIYRSLSNLHIELVRLYMSFDEVIERPADAIVHILQLARLFIGVGIPYQRPRKHRGGKSHRQTELHEVTRIEPPAAQVPAALRFVVRAGSLSPLDPVRLRQLAASLCFVKEYR